MPIVQASAAGDLIRPLMPNSSANVMAAFQACKGLLSRIVQTLRSNEETLPQRAGFSLALIGLTRVRKRCTQRSGLLILFFSGWDYYISSDRPLRLLLPL